VHGSVAVAAQGDQIGLGIPAGLAPALEVMDLEPRQRAASLTFPAVPLQDFPLPLAVALGVEPKPPSFPQVSTHADRRMSCKNCCWWAAVSTMRHQGKFGYWLLVGVIVLAASQLSSAPKRDCTSLIAGRTYTQPV
jgi:hypothetical protein